MLQTSNATMLHLNFFKQIILKGIKMGSISCLLITISLSLSTISFAGIETGINGIVTDASGVSVAGAKIQIFDSNNKIVKNTITDMAGGFHIFPMDFGTYVISIDAQGFSHYKLTTVLSSGTPAQLNVTLSEVGNNKELVINVKEKKNLVQISSSGSKKDINKEQIASSPLGDDVSLPKLLSSSSPGIIAGPFGQMFIRGNHANIQYQIDGVQLPESTSGAFGDAFSPRNIDHMEFITGGIPAEYGERMSAVVNIITKSGPEKFEGDADVSYGSYNTITPQATVGGSNSEGNIHYYTSIKYNQTSRGLDTPQPSSFSNQSQGGTDSTHNQSSGDEEFIRVDDVLDNTNKVTITAFNSTKIYQIPNFPGSFSPNDPSGYFQTGYTDQFGNQNTSSPTFNYVPQYTNDNQTEQNSFLQLVWKKTLSDSSFLQIAPYYKRSALNIGNDLLNDLATAPGGSAPITGAQPDSFLLSRVTNNFGIKTDYTIRSDDKNLWKAGFQYQLSQSTTANMNIWAINTTNTTLTQALANPYNFSGFDNGQLAAIYVQDSYAMTPKLTWNLGLRLSGTTFQSSQISSQDGLIQPRIGVEYLITENTKIHAYYGKLFQPAPFENLREAFSTVGGGQPTPYDVLAEKDDYYEVGISQQLAQSHTVSLIYYYKNATNMLDDTQLLNTAISQPYNFAQGYANGVELSLSGDITNNLSDFFNYSYEDARGEGISGGIFAFSTSTLPPNSYQFLDHIQLNTANAGLTFRQGQLWTTLQSLYGSGLRTGPNNGVSLPAHLSFDYTLGYKFLSSNTWFEGAHIAVDWLNVTNNVYPITIANGFNGSHYAAGTEFIVHIGKEF
jgi:hypothetical protein